jgi:NitT/TauT family transport system substrate-binding protein
MTRWLGAAVLAAISFGAQAQPVEKPNVSLSIGAFVINYLPLPVAQSQGFFKEEGLNVTLQDFHAGGNRALQALIGGSTDVVLGIYTHTIQMQAQKKDIRCVVQVNDLPGAVLAVRKPLADKVNMISDLAGMKIGVTGLGSFTEQFLRFSAKKYGLDLSKVSLVSVGSGASAVAAVEQGSVDAIVMGEPAATVLQQRGLVKNLLDTRTRQATIDLFGGTFPSACIYTAQDFIEKNPGTIQHLVNAFSKTLVWLNGHTPQQIVAVTPKDYLVGNDQEALGMVTGAREMFPKNGLIKVEDAQHVLDITKDYDPIVAKANVDVTKTFTNRFVEAAIKAGIGK